MTAARGGVGDAAPTPRPAPAAARRPGALAPVAASLAEGPADTDAESELSADATPTVPGPANDAPSAKAATPIRTPLLTDATTFTPKHG